MVFKNKLSFLFQKLSCKKCGKPYQIVEVKQGEYWHANIMWKKNNKYIINKSLYWIPPKRFKHLDCDNIFTKTRGNLKRERIAPFNLFGGYDGSSIYSFILLDHLVFKCKCGYKIDVYICGE